MGWIWDITENGCVIKSNLGQGPIEVICPDTELAVDQIVANQPSAVFETNASRILGNPTQGESLYVKAYESGSDLKGVRVPLVEDADVGSIDVDPTKPATYVSYKMQGVIRHLSREQVVAMVSEALKR